MSRFYSPDSASGIIASEDFSAEKALRESEAGFKASAKLAPDLLWSNDTSGEKTWFNDAWYQYTGQTPESALGDGWLDVVHPDDRKHISANFNNAIKTRKASRQEYRIYNAAEKRFHWFLVQAEPVVDRSGNIRQWLGAATDVDEVRKADEARRITEERLGLIMDSAEMGAWDYLVHEDKITWNKQHYIMLGLTPDHDTKTLSYFNSFVHEEDLAALSALIRNAIQRCDVFKAEFRIVRADNKKIRWMNAYGRTIEKDEHGHAARMVGVLYDITEKKILEQHKDEFIAIASHELKTPVTSIKGYAQILQHLFGKANLHEYTELIQKLDKQVDRLTGIINNLLATTKMIEGKLPLNLSRVSLDKLIDERIEDFQKTTDRHQIVFTAGVVPDIEADKDRIEQVLNNLISNAIKYSPAGGKISVSTSVAGQLVQVTVQDEGIGIPDEAVRKIFERFYRVSSPETEALAGMGLGLYISAAIIQRHGGTISVKSKLQKGSAFQFTLPINGKHV